MIITNKWDQRFLRLAKEISTWSKDPSTQVGCVIVDPKTRRILSTGYNGFPAGIDDTAERLDNRETKYKLIVHAEMNAIYNATHNGQSLTGATAYIINQPLCQKCALGIISVGIKRVVMIKVKTWGQRWIDDFNNNTKPLLLEAGIEFDVFSEDQLGKVVSLY